MAMVSPPAAGPGAPAGEAPSRPAHWRKRLFAWGLAVAALAFVVHAVPLRDHCVDPTAPLTCQPGLLSTLGSARLGLIAALLALYLSATLLWSARWRALLRLARVPLRFGEIWRINVEAQAGGILLPGGIGGDALRVGFVVGRGGKLATVIASTLLDRVIGLVTSAAIAAGLGALVLADGQAPALLGVLASLPVGFVIGVAILRSRAVANLPFLARGPLAKVARPVLEYVGEPAAPRAIATGLAFSLGISAIHMGVIRGLVAALGGVPAQESWIYIGTTMAFIVSAIPALPGGWGTGDAAFVYFFGKAGLAPSVALAVSLVYRLFWYASGGIGAVLYLLRSHASSPKE